MRVLIFDPDKSVIHVFVKILFVGLDESETKRALE